jgi:hypothetical protein
MAGPEPYTNKTLAVGRRVRERKEIGREPRHTPDQTTEKLPIPLPAPTFDVPKLLKAARNPSVAEERVSTTQRA